MSDVEPGFQSKIWQEEAEADNPFAAHACYCHGYDVYGDVLGKAGWAEYLYLLFRGERPSPSQARMLDALMVALANRGPRDPAVRAAMNGGVGGSTAAGSLMAALAVGAGQYGGAHEVCLAMQLWAKGGLQLEAWETALGQLSDNRNVDIWLPVEHAPGFDPNGESCPTPVRQTLAYLAHLETAGPLGWLMREREALEALAGAPLAMTGVVAAALFSLGFSPEQGEMLFLFSGLPGAAVHALEQQETGWRKFPFVGNRIHLQDDPGPMGMPDISEFGL
ncbi:citrate synthase [Fluviicoccus keumensis]|uniref:Citrate synthase n=1 Tax=Fluviicoccus keumensis TaxID=1435465 RepID=A0A4Q7YM22_9GAMM|nr:citryl-CoA lyase [Fluviicoccus keumensis]RZU38358.1 citrate synthase [Fluviicoccus keumensis]